jgi:hypothetical protein
MSNNNRTARYEILDSMEIKVAEADSFNDAMFAAEKYSGVVYSTEKGRTVYDANRQP